MAFPLPDSGSVSSPPAPARPEPHHFLLPAATQGLILILRPVCSVSVERGKEQKSSLSFTFICLFLLPPESPLGPWAKNCSNKYLLIPLTEEAFFFFLLLFFPSEYLRPQVHGEPPPHVPPPLLPTRPGLIYSSLSAISPIFSEVQDKLKGQKGKGCLRSLADSVWCEGRREKGVGEG